MHTTIYGAYLAPFGQTFIAIHNDAICKLAFYENEREYNDLVAELRKDTGLVQIIHDPEFIESYAKRVFNLEEWNKIQLHLIGTSFQKNVWNTLKKVPLGQTISYQDVANLIGKPKAVRAVASAIAKNKVAYLIPCHRVIRKNGDIGEFRWGSHRKRAILDWENGLCQR